MSGGGIIDRSVYSLTLTPSEELIITTPKGVPEINFKNEFVSVMSDPDDVKLCNVVDLMEYIQAGGTYHPETKTLFTKEELSYFKFQYNKYLFIKDKDLNRSDYEELVVETKNSIFDNFLSEKSVQECWKDSRENGTFTSACYLLTIIDFVDHFQSHVNFSTVQNNFYTFERKNVDIALKKAEPGTWLFRYSSRNSEPENPSSIIYYALSLKRTSGKIDHVLIKYQHGMGWFHTSRNSVQVHFPSFMEFFERLSISYNLDLTKVLPGYRDI